MLTPASTSTKPAILGKPRCGLSECQTERPEGSKEKQSPSTESVGGVTPPHEKAICTKSYFRELSINILVNIVIYLSIFVFHVILLPEILTWRFIYECSKFY